MKTQTGTMPTDRPARYAKQLLSHWSERGTLTQDGTQDGTASTLDWHTGQVLTLTPREGSARRHRRRARRRGRPAASPTWWPATSSGSASATSSTWSGTRRSA